MFAIRPPEPDDKPAWLVHWRAYIEFYGSRIADDVTEATWARLLDADEPSLFGYVACDESGAVIGLVHCVAHPVTWSKTHDCYLEDLFVDPAARGQGTGQALIDAVIGRARTEGWRKVYWRTAQDNVTARKLYDRFTEASDWVTYEVTV